MSREEAVKLIREHIEESLFEPAGNWNNYQFRERSYSRWAANRLIDEIKESDRDPVRTIMSFVEKMDGFSNKGNEADFIFSTARSTASTILYLFEEDYLR